MTSNPNSDAIARLVSMLEGVDDGALDEAVIEAKSHEASGINNGGFDDQIEYLIEMYGVDGAAEIISGVVNSETIRS